MKVGSNDLCMTLIPFTGLRRKKQNCCAGNLIEIMKHWDSSQAVFPPVPKAFELCHDTEVTICVVRWITGYEIARSARTQQALYFSGVAGV